MLDGVARKKGKSQTKSACTALLFRPGTIDGWPSPEQVLCQADVPDVAHPLLLPFHGSLLNLLLVEYLMTSGLVMLVILKVTQTHQRNACSAGKAHRKYALNAELAFWISTDQCFSWHSVACDRLIKNWNSMKIFQWSVHECLQVCLYIHYINALL